MSKILVRMLAGVGLAVLWSGCASRPLAPLQGGTPTSLTLANDHRPAISVVLQPAQQPVRSQKSGRTIVPGIDIFPDGHCFVRRLDGTETEKNIGVVGVRELVAFLDEQGFFFLSNDKLAARLEEADVPQISVDRHGPAVFYKLREATPVNYRTALQVRLTGGTVLVSRWDLDLERHWFPQMRELHVLRACVDKVFAAAGEKW